MKKLLLTTGLAASFFIGSPKIQAIATNHQAEIGETITQPKDSIHTPIQRTDGEKEDGKIYFPSLGLVLEIVDHKIDSTTNLQAHTTQQQFDKIIKLIGVEQAVEVFGRGTTYLAKNEETGQIEARTFRKINGVHEGIVREENGEYRTNYTPYNPPLSETHTWLIKENTLNSKMIQTHNICHIISKSL